MKYLIILLTLLCFSCVSNHKIKKELEILQSKSITIPTDVEFYTNGKKSEIKDFLDSELKLIIYTDSVGCNTCAISQIGVWTSLVHYTKAFNNKLKYYFIFSPGKHDEHIVRLALKNTTFDYPVILDNKGIFKKQNPHLPKNKMMHTFLLDKDNNVILVGNSVNNEEINKLLKATIKDKLN